MFGKKKAPTPSPIGRFIEPKPLGDFIAEVHDTANPDTQFHLMVLDGSKQPAVRCVGSDRAWTLDWRQIVAMAIRDGIETPTPPDTAPPAAEAPAADEAA